MSNPDHKPPPNPTDTTSSTDEEDDFNDAEENEEDSHTTDVESDDDDGDDDDDNIDTIGHDHIYSSPYTKAPPPPPPDHDHIDTTAHDHMYSCPPSNAPPSSKQSKSYQVVRYVLSQLLEIARIYVKFAILALIICLAAAWYALHFDEIDVLKDKHSGSVRPRDSSEEDRDTCPAVLSA